MAGGKVRIDSDYSSTVIVASSNITYCFQYNLYSSEWLHDRTYLLLFDWSCFGLRRSLASAKEASNVGRHCAMVYIEGRCRSVL